MAEALTNLAKHSGAAHAAVTARTADGHLRVEVRDDGVGGARPSGTGLIGLNDRLTALGGRLRVESPSVHGTRIVGELPLGSYAASSRGSTPPRGAITSRDR